MIYTEYINYNIRYNSYIHYNIHYDFFNLLAATRCCHDKRLRNEEDEGLGPSLIRVGQDNSI